MDDVFKFENISSTHSIIKFNATFLGSSNFTTCNSKGQLKFLKSYRYLVVFELVFHDIFNL